MTGNDTFRVNIDVKRIQSNLWLHERGRLTEENIRRWLMAVGFRPVPLRQWDECTWETCETWTADGDTLRRLDRSEVVVLERV